MKQIAETIADNLRSFREQRGLSLDGVSELTGVSKSMLRQIEMGRSSPTISTLWKIANGLKISFTTLLKRRDTPVAIRDFRGEGPLTAEGGGYRVYPILTFDPGRPFEIYYMEIDEGVTYEGEPHQGALEESVFVLSGELEMRVGGSRYRARKEQCISFAPNQPHDYHNAGAGMVVVLLAISYPG